MNMMSNMTNAVPFSGKLKGEIRSYEQFMTWTEELVADEMTSGPNQSEELAGYTALNLKRMQRLNKTLKASEEIKELLRKINGTYHFWVFTEAWCGDSAQILPAINRLCELSDGKIQLHVVMRDENLEVMDLHRTNGGLAIPKLVSMDDKGKELFSWGARPAGAQDVLLDWKANPNGRSKADFEVDLHKWYTRDKGQAVMQELASLIGEYFT